MTPPSSSSPEPWAPQLIGGVDVDAVATAAQSCIDVDSLDGGPFDAVASYLPGRRVPGVRVAGDRVTVQVRTRWGAPVPQVAAQLRAALAPVLGDHGLDIVVSDIANPPELQPDAVELADPPEEEVVWTSSSAGPGGPGSASTTPTEAGIQPASPPVSPPSTPPPS